MSLIKNNNTIHFRKTTAAEFAEHFSWFHEWLYETDEDGRFVNIDGIDASSAHLSITRKKKLPEVDVVSDSSNSDLISGYFLEDIKVVYFRGKPYETPDDYITTAEYTDASVFSVDKERHILYIPKISIDGIDIKSQFGVAYIHQLDSTGLFNPNLKDSSLSVYVTAENSGKTFTINQSMVEGQKTDSITAVSYWGLKNYIDSKISSGDGGSSIDAYWEEEE